MWYLLVSCKGEPYKNLTPTKYDYSKGATVDDFRIYLKKEYNHKMLLGEIPVASLLVYLDQTAFHNNNPLSEIESLENFKNSFDTPVLVLVPEFEESSRKTLTVDAVRDIAGVFNRSDAELKSGITSNYDFPLNFVDRSDLYDEIAESMIMRYCRRQELGTDVADERRVNMYEAIHGIPGSGKSRALWMSKDGILEAIRAKRSTPSYKYLEQAGKLEVVLQESAFIYTSFNMLTTLKPLEEHPLPLRILFEYFFKVKKPSVFDNFEKEILKRGFAIPTLAEAVDIVKKASKKQNVFLCIDEVGRVGNDVRLSEFLDSVAVALLKDSDYYNHVLLSNAIVSDLTKYKSRRAVKIHKLNPIKDIASVFPTIILGDYRDIASQAGGHPRTLECIYEISKHMKGTAISREQIFNMLQERMNEFGSTLNLKFLRPVLQRKAYHLSDKIRGTDITLETCLETGIYMNSLNGNESKIVPRTSMLRIALMPLSSSSIREKSIESIVRRLYFLGRSFNGYDFELFHCSWELLFRLTFKRKKALSLGHLYNGARFGNEGLRNVCISVKREYKITEHKVNFADLTRNDWEVLKQGNELFLFGGSNSGFDGALVADVAFNSEKVLFLYKSRYSTTESSTTDDKAMNNNYYFNSIAETLGFVRQYNISKVIYVLVTHRKVSCTQIPDNCILIDREAFDNVYGSIFSLET